MASEEVLKQHGGWFYTLWLLHVALPVDKKLQTAIGSPVSKVLRRIFTSMRLAASLMQFKHNSSKVGLCWSGKKTRSCRCRVSLLLEGLSTFSSFAGRGPLALTTQSAKGIMDGGHLWVRTNSWNDTNDAALLWEACKTVDSTGGESHCRIFCRTLYGKPHDDMSPIARSRAWTSWTWRLLVYARLIFIRFWDIFHTVGSSTTGSSIYVVARSLSNA